MKTRFYEEAGAFMWIDCLLYTLNSAVMSEEVTVHANFANARMYVSFHFDLAFFENVSPLFFVERERISF